MKKLALVSLLVLSACSEIPPQAYFNRGDPENLLDRSTEVVHMSVSSHAALAQISDMVKQDAPTRVDMECLQDDVLCLQAKHLIDSRGIPTKWADSKGGGVSLIYERVVARECTNRYIDNSINPYNLNPPTFGCSVTSNTVQMVSDKRQFTNPHMLDFQDGEKAAQTYEAYLEPVKPADEKRAAPSLMSGVK